MLRDSSIGKGYIFQGRRGQQKPRKNHEVGRVGRQSHNAFRGFRGTNQYLKSNLRYKTYTVLCSKYTPTNEYAGFLPTSVTKDTLQK